MFLKWGLKLRKMSDILCEDEHTMSSAVRHQPCRSNVLRHWLEQQYATKLTVVLWKKTEEIYNNFHL